MTPPTVSVVMSVFNGERFLREAVDSILSQTFEDFEFIIIDDGSTDGSAAILDSYGKVDPRVQVYHQENRGLVDALNRGCGSARGKYIARMDADDIALRDRLRRQVEFMEAHAEVGVLGGAIQYIDAVGRGLATLRLPIHDRDIKSALRYANPMAHPTAFLRKDVFTSVGGYRRIFAKAEDYDLWLRVAKRGQLANLKAVVLRYRLHPGQQIHAAVRQQAMCVVAARAVAALSGDGEPDALSSASEINPAVLARLGVTEAALERAVATQYQGSIRAMCLARQDSAALQLVSDMFRSSPWHHVERRVIANIWLLAAGAHWRQGEPLRSLAAVGYALMVRPAVSGRPVKQSLRRVLGAIFPGWRKGPLALEASGLEREKDCKP
jgi:hypothetical protein